jgi:MoaA/NifB/PqqE/SkfB family radical SAM enzyme
MPQKTFEEVRSLLPYLEHVIWLGGEVFLSDYFKELLEETKNFPQLAQRINTNGILIDEGWAEKLFQNNIELIYSIDGVSKDTYENIRKGANFNDLIKSLEIINSKREKYKNKDFHLRMNVVIMRSNYHEIGGFIDFARQYGFDLVQLMPIVGEDTAEHIFSTKYKDEKIWGYIYSETEKLKAKAKEYNIELLNSLPALDVSSQEPAEVRFDIDGPFCYLPWQQLLIYPDGNVRFGCFCDDPIGNVLENSIEQIWNSDKAQVYRKKISSNNYQDLCGSRCVQGRISIKLRRIGEADLYL